MDNGKKTFKEFLVSPAGKMILIAVLYLVIICIVSAIIHLSGSAPAVMGILSVVFIFFGWKALTKITPAIFLTMPIIGWVIYFVIKGVLAYLLGIFVAPFVIAKKITEAVESSMQ